jgi:hypothetical protein
MRFTVNRRQAARAPGAVPRPTRTEVNQALCSVIENRVMQLSTCLAWFVLSNSAWSARRGCHKASGSDWASRSSLVVTKLSPAQQAASASRNPVPWRLVRVRPWSP